MYDAIITSPGLSCFFQLTSLSDA